MSCPEPFVRPEGKGGEGRSEGLVKLPLHLPTRRLKLPARVGWGAVPIQDWVALNPRKGGCLAVVSRMQKRMGTQRVRSPGGRSVGPKSLIKVTIN